MGENILIWVISSLIVLLIDKIFFSDVSLEWLFILLLAIIALSFILKFIMMFGKRQWYSLHIVMNRNKTNSFFSLFSSWNVTQNIWADSRDWINAQKNSEFDEICNDINDICQYEWWMGREADKKVVQSKYKRLVRLSKEISKDIPKQIGYFYEDAQM